MKKEEFNLLKEGLKNQIEEINNKISELKVRYISENRKFNDGERVCITVLEHKEWYGDKIVPEQKRFAYIESVGIEYNGEIKYVLRKEKKDGSMSLQRDYYSSQQDILEKAI